MLPQITNVFQAVSALDEHKPDWELNTNTRKLPELQRLIVKAALMFLSNVAKEAIDAAIEHVRKPKTEKKKKSLGAAVSASVPPAKEADRAPLNTDSTDTE